jgi:hypothetical protein
VEQRGAKRNGVKKLREKNMSESME